MHEEDGELGIGGNEHEEEEEDGGLYSQTFPFYQQPVALQRMQFAHSASATSVSSMSSTTTTPPPPPPPQPSVASVQPLKQQQQNQPATAQTLTSLASSATAVNIYQEQALQQHAHQPQQQHQQKLRPEQMTSATAANGNFNINVNASAATAAAYKRQEQKLRRLRELHSLALEGGDTARGYCSCDEQWTSSSPPISDSPTLSSNEGHEKTSDGSEANETIQAAAATTIITKATAKPTSAETTAAMTAERRVTGNAYKQINVTTGRGRLAVGGNDGGHSRTRQQQKHNNSTIDGVGNIWTGTRANEVAKAAAAVVAAKAAGAGVSTAAMAGAVRGESRPMPAARLKQQHHVRFSDEKNFSD
ncbi:lysine-specific demethylase 6B-like [Anastrepha obliqua]|uniref:lysine-specific demethylase 6B-like n=1 Tax=Anastrepha obliqua TaxID=95512 RepID=UPI002409C297|nr:lysine-specific demethylase 6B-like [Anastrepha obliqua]